MEKEEEKEEEEKKEVELDENGNLIVRPIDKVSGSDSSKTTETVLIVIFSLVGVIAIAFTVYVLYQRKFKGKLNGNFSFKPTKLRQDDQTND